MAPTFLHKQIQFMLPYARRKHASRGENGQGEKGSSESGELRASMESKEVLGETGFSKSNSQNWKGTR